MLEMSIAQITPPPTPSTHLRIRIALAWKLVTNKMGTASDRKISRESCCYFGMFQYGGHQRVYGLKTKNYIDIAGACCRLQELNV